MEPRVVFPRSLQYLLAIAEHGSYTRAAEALHISQPALSQQIRQLEASLQSLLVDRSGRSMRLTPAGEVYLLHARRARGEMAAGVRAIQDLQALSCGSLRLGWTPITDYLTCSLLAKFDSLYPGITLSTFEMPQGDIETAVMEGRIDLGIVFSKAFPSKLPSSDVDSTTLFTEKLCLAIGNDHCRAGQTAPMNPQELARESLVLLNTDFALRQHIDRYCCDHGIAPRIAVATNSLSVIIEMVTLGSLSTVLPKSIICRQPGLAPIRLSPEIPDNAITVICRKAGYKSAACRAFGTLALDWAERGRQPKTAC